MELVKRVRKRERKEIKEATRKRETKRRRVLKKERKKERKRGRVGKRKRKRRNNVFGNQRETITKVELEVSSIVGKTFV